MRVLVRSAVTLAATAGLVAVGAAPAAAGPLGPCPAAEPVCVYVPAGVYPVGNPVVTGPLGVPVSRVDLPRVCDSSGTDCVETFLIVPGVSAESTGGSLATVDFPGLGVGIDGTTVTLYASPPTVTPTPGAFGINVGVAADLLFLGIEGTPRDCQDDGPTTVGPVTMQTRSCLTTITLSI